MIITILIASFLKRTWGTAFFVSLTVFCVQIPFVNVSANNTLTDDKVYNIDSLITVVDGTVAPYHQLEPGDTLNILAGNRQNLLLQNISGSSEKPIVIINKGGIVTFNTDSYYGISIRNCRFIHLTGQGSTQDFYGIRIERVAGGAGIGIGDRSSDFEIDHISIANTLLGGIYAKTDPECNTSTTRNQFTQFNTNIHDNRIANVGNEGMYIGSTKYDGITQNCDGKDTLLLPSVLKGVRIYNNILEYTAWDGIQVSSATEDCRIYGNMVLYDSQEGYFSQMSGIMLGGGSKCDCYNNYISQGKGNGIESHGLGGYRIFNNIIVDAGQSYLPLDSTERKFGIYVSDISVEKDSSFQLLFNTIINPKTDGIRFQSIASRQNIISSNLILNPGAYDYYENGNTSYTGDDAYIMIPDHSSDVILQNNYKSRSIQNTGISMTDFKPLKGSPLIDAASTNLFGVDFDFAYKDRPNGSAADIGAFEYDHFQVGTDTMNQNNALMAYPNPVRSMLNVRFSSNQGTEASLMIYDLSGKLLIKQSQVYQTGDVEEIKVQVDGLGTGIYLFSLKCGEKIQSGKMIKIS